MGGSPADSSASPDLSAALSELAQGRDSVVRLAVLLLENLPEDRVNDPSTARFLLEEIMDTITKAMAVLESGKNQDPVTTQADSPSSDVTSQSHGGKRKMQSPRKTSSRKRGNPYSCRRITSDTIEDGYTWRKYGQKEIYGAKYPRSYFRCTHKYDRECMATRQVQKSEENPSMYMITYFGEHACGTSATAMAACRDPCIISFESSNGGHAKQETSIIPSCQSLSQQREEEALSNVSTIEEPVYFEFGLDQSDSLSGLLSSATSYGMEFMDLEDIISLDHIVLFQP